MERRWKGLPCLLPIAKFNPFGVPFPIRSPSDPQTFNAITVRISSRIVASLTHRPWPLWHCWHEAALPTA